ncbi:ORF6N domain-containing protein [Mucilaginibacter sp.]|uniref:ORF6N domain-containing protein n=1 Tax=Mucilaginibacter sp. TaxID=1882438 RepID=UPI0025E1F840|nr:ORF6N domain-containing protein [Mucilaginibacter sp.]
MNKEIIIPEERILTKIFLIRGEKVILDVHLAELYGVETRALKQAVKRNSGRFPPDFMYVLTEQEIEAVVSQNVIPHKKFFGGSSPYAFSETGVAMLSSVLKSDKAVEMNIMIIRTFVTLRKIALNYREIMQKLETMESENDGKFKEIYAALNHLLSPPNPPRKRIGYKSDDL